MKPNKFISQIIFLLLVFIANLSRADEITRPQVNQTEPLPDIAEFLNIGQALPVGYDWTNATPYFWSMMSGTKQIYRLNDHGWPAQLTSFANGYDFFVLNYGGNQAIVGASEGGSEQSQLYLLDTESGHIKQLTHFEHIRFGSVIWGKDDRTLFYRSNAETGKDYFIYEYDLDTERESKIFGDTTGVRGNLFIANISQAGNSLIVYHLNSNVSNDLYLVDIESGEGALITDPNPGRDVTYKYPVLQPDGRTILLISDKNDDGIQRLARLKLGSYDLRFVNDGWLDPSLSVDNLIVSRDYRWMAVIVNQHGYVDAKIRELESKLELPMPDDLKGMVAELYFTSDSSVMFSFKGPTRAPDLWRWRMYDEQLEQLTYSSYAGIDREQFVEPSLLTYTSFDSLEIPAFLYLPANYTGDHPIPFIIEAHGGPEAQFQPGFIRNIQYLLMHGYGVFAPNVRGSAGYGSAYLALDDYQLRQNVLKDYKAATDYLISEGYSAPGLIGIRGESYGGYVVLGMITEYPELFGAAAEASGISNFVIFLQNTAAYRLELREAEYGPLSDTAFLNEISPIWKASEIKTPLLIVHGENDSRVPVSEARQMAQAILEHGGVVDTLIFSDEGHIPSKRDNIITEYRKQIEFFDRYLKSNFHLLLPIAPADTSSTNQE